MLLLAPHVVRRSKQTDRTAMVRRIVMASESPGARIDLAVAV